MRRRCRYIVLCDATCDPDYSFDELGNAIRKCKVDFGISIEIATNAIMPDPSSGTSRAHCAIGRIHYEDVDKTVSAATGYLLYIKASVTGDEPADVLHYRTANPAFPHQSTGDQMYSESQFESYRALGEHIAQAVLQEAREDESVMRAKRAMNIRDPRAFLEQARTGVELRRHGSPGISDSLAAASPRGDRVCDRQVLFERLAVRWVSPSRFPAPSTTHADVLQQLLSRLGIEPQLRFLKGLICPDWVGAKTTDSTGRSHNLLGGLIEAVAEVVGPAHRPHDQNGPYPLPDDEDERLVGFYFCNALIQSMEGIYEDAHLEEEWERPANRGWMNLFRLFARSVIFRATWATTVSTRSTQFQQFCRRHLALEIGSFTIGRWVKANNILNQNEALYSDLLSPVELHQLRVLKQTSPNWQWDDIYVAPLCLRVRDPASEPFYFGIGFALIRPDDQDGSQLHYYRIRDHLHRMGLGRRGLEALWREDCRLTLRPVPQELSIMIPDTDGDRLMRLWHSVLAAVPDREIKRAELLLDVFEDIGEILHGADSNSWTREICGLLITLLPDTVDRLTPVAEQRLRNLKEMMRKWTTEAHSNQPTDVLSQDAGDRRNHDRDLVLVEDLKRVIRQYRLTECHDPTEPKEVLAQAETLLSMAISAYEEAIARQPDNEEAWRGVARVLRERARLAENRHDWELTLSHLKSATQILDEIVEDNEFASLAYYNRACCQVLAGHVVREHPSSKRLPGDPFKDLEKAFWIRPDLKDFAQKDKDLESIYDSHSFRCLVETESDPGAGIA